MCNVTTRKLPNPLNEYLTYYFLQYGQVFIVSGKYAVTIVEGEHTDELRLIDGESHVIGPKQMALDERAEYGLILSDIVCMKPPMDMAITCPACKTSLHMNIMADNGQWYMQCPVCGIQTRREDLPQLAMKAAHDIESIVNRSSDGTEGETNVE